MAKLGKGLASIFGDNIDSVLDEISNGESEIKGSSADIAIKDIRTNPYQPRKTFDKQALEELAASIKEHGVFQPLLVRKSLNGYELIAGERRLRASKIAGLKEVPCLIVDFDDRDMMEISILENIQREDLTVLEEAEAYEQLIDKLDYSQEDLAKRLGKSRPYVANTLRLQKLPASIKELLRKDKISAGHARALLNVEDEAKALEIANEAAKKGLSVREVENKVKTLDKKKVVKVKDRDPYLEAVRRTMEGRLGTAVNLTKKNITISYNDNDDLNRILEIIGCLEEE
ncbi:MAG: ParB/RepB/Spo0J family partition protein [Erysipelotrichaceae bacterium]|nr:ParB/RepB/Spo0J family partition protein [Erysipelotrichaceae bacterium]